MKGGFFSLHILNELLDPLVRQLIGYSAHKNSVVLDLPVNFLALVAHLAGPKTWRPQRTTASTVVLFKLARSKFS
jgi:hypothetical protein